MNLIRLRKIAAFLAAFALSGPVTPAQTVAGTSLNIATTAAHTNGSLTVNDASNRVWVIEVSTNLTSWNQFAIWKVFNGDYHTTIGYSSSGPMSFYRAIFDPAQQTIADATTNALLLPSSYLNYANYLLPSYLLVPAITNQDNTPADNPITDAGATLGRVLFYDKRLSTNQTISCASCHQQAYAFSDPRTVSIGYNGSKGTRNAMGLNFSRYYQRAHFFWDERATTLEAQVLQPIQNPIEMGMTLPTLVTRLSGEPYYTNLFAQAFGTTSINTNLISLALAQFVRSIVTTNSKYDQGVLVGFTNFTAQENLGRQIFFGKVGNATCSACHATDVETAANIFNNGLEYPYVDTGVGGITGVAAQDGLFKVPSLRNIALTAPYMHDGRFTTLAQVVGFYTSNVVANPNLSPPLQVPPGPGVAPGTPLRLNLTTAQQAALVAFLNTLTDTSITNDPRFSDPFNYGN